MAALTNKPKSKSQRNGRWSDFCPTIAVPVAHVSGAPLNLGNITHPVSCTECHINILGGSASISDGVFEGASTNVDKSAVQMNPKVAPSQKIV